MAVEMCVCGHSDLRHTSDGCMECPCNRFTTIDDDPTLAFDDRSLWTCNGCDADYNGREMAAAMKMGPNGIWLLICTVCGRQGDFRDGPDVGSTSGWSICQDGEVLARPIPVG